MRILFALLLTGLLAFPAQAQPDSFCLPAVGFDFVMEKYQEKPVFAYEQPDAGVVKVMYANPLTGDWTLVGVDMSMTACTLAHGNNLMRRAATMELPLYSGDDQAEPES